jgi:superfamily I DNA/RNA helicase/RecB family exonuclease
MNGAGGLRSSVSSGYRLVRTSVAVGARPRLDAAQQAVVDRVSSPGCGPLLVLAGPGTGKTTTLVEAVAARVEAGTSPERVLTLTFSRKAASELRDRITGRLGRALALQPAWTFHAFCLALAAEARAPEDVGRRVRLLSGPEQDVVVRELLAGDRADGGRAWPADLAAALGTRGFADEVRGLLARARGYGLEPADLAELGRGGGRPDWLAASRFLDTYLTVLDDLGSLDYAELVHRAVLYAESTAGREALSSRFDLVVVDEYQDTDPGQERLLQALAGDGRDLVAVGDPDQSIYAFRGADLHGLLDFRARFAQRDGTAADVLTLAVSRRAGVVLLAASRTVALRMPLSGSGLSGVLRDHRALRAADHVVSGTAAAWTFPSAAAQLETIADLLRREHLDDGTPWSAMAVLVRSGARSIPLVQRALGAAGIPVEVAGDELPLARESAVAPLLLALRVAVNPAELTQDATRALLLSPLGGLDSSALRRLGRLLRTHERVTGHGELPRPSAELIREVVAEPPRLDELPQPAAGRRPDVAIGAARRLGELLERAAERVRVGGSAHDVLWLLWDATAWPRRLERTSATGGPDGRAADRDLDAVVALFEAATRDDERAQRRGPAAFLEELAAQQIPADTLGERATRGEAVRLLTAHRSKGLEWDVVVVCDVQEEVWPDLRRRGSLLEADRLRSDGLVQPPSPSELLAEERRLFYVAVTRARRRLVVTAVDSPEDDGQRPSRFLAELGVPVVQLAGRARRPLTLTALVAELRSVATDPRASGELRAAAAGRLARLGSERTAGGLALVPSALPDTWWGLDDVTVSETALHPVDQPLPLSASSITGIAECPLRWFLDHEAGGQSARGSALGFGSVVHALAHGVGQGTYEPDVDALMLRVDQVWTQLAFEAVWQSESQRLQARAALGRFLLWQAKTAADGRVLVGTEVEFRTTVQVGEREVLLRGSMDRVELDVDGRVVVVDLKTGKNKPTKNEVADHPQLGLYQLAVRSGALGDLPQAAGHEPGGAELVHLRIEGKGGLPDMQSQPAPDAGQPLAVEEQLAVAVARLVAEDFPPTPGDRCGRCAYRRACPAQPDGRGVLT